MTLGFLNGFKSKFRCLYFPLPPFLANERSRGKSKTIDKPILKITATKIHGMKGFVIPTNSLVKIGITKIFCYNNKMLSSTNKTFGCCSKILGCSNKKKIIVPNFVAVTKLFFSVIWNAPF